MTVLGSFPGETKGRTLVIGATGFMGRFIAEASLDSGRTTYVLIRPGSIGPVKFKIVRALQDKGAVVVHVCSPKHECHMCSLYKPVSWTDKVMWLYYKCQYLIHLYGLFLGDD